jgi:hypothetical protein
VKYVLAVLGSVAIMGAAIYGGIVLLWVGGIEQVVRGAEASPVNGGDIAWGLVKSVGFGDLAIGAGIVLTFLIWLGVIGSGNLELGKKA